MHTITVIIYIFLTDNKATMTFELHPQLVQDCIERRLLKLCRLLLMNDSQFPWFLLVPERLGLTEQ